MPKAKMSPENPPWSGALDPVGPPEPCVLATAPEDALALGLPAAPLASGELLALPGSLADAAVLGAAVFCAARLAPNELTGPPLLLGELLDPPPQAAATNTSRDKTTGTRKSARVWNIVRPPRNRSVVDLVADRPTSRLRGRINSGHRVLQTR
jgi:hypothetical protein